MDEGRNLGDRMNGLVSRAAGRVRAQVPGRASRAMRGELIPRGFARAPAAARSAFETISTVGWSGGGWWGRSLLALVLAPTLLYFLYAALWQTRGYEAEARVTVRGAQEMRGSVGESSGIVARLASGGPSSKSTIQDAYIVLNYIKSPAMLIDLGGAPYLEKYFSGLGIDYLSRLSRGGTIEDLGAYWRRRVAANVDTVSGIVTVQVEAFKAADSSAIARDIVRLSEQLINTISERSRRDAVERGQKEVSLAADKLAVTRDRLTSFRDRSALIDPAVRAKNVAEIIAKLTLDKVTIESSLATLQGSLQAEAPSQRIQRAKLATIDKQIATLNKSLTDSQNEGALSSQIAAYERLKLDEQFDELMYTVAQGSYQRARQELERQQLYLVVVVPPSTPERALYPKVTANTLMLLSALFVFWSIGALIVASVNDQMT